MRDPRVFITVLVLLFCNTLAAEEIVATPGTYELLEGTTMQFDARSNERSGDVKSYRWSIIAGEGASLVNANEARVTFVAPAIGEDTRLFTLQLALEYNKGDPSTAQINIRVHRKTKEKTVSRTSPWVSGTIGFGFGYLWGGWWPHPPLIVIPCPPPETEWPPEEIPPIAMPLPEDPEFDDWAELNPDLAEADVDDAGLEAEALPVDEDPLPSEIDIETAPMIEPAPHEDPMPAFEPEPEPMDMPMDMPMDFPMDMPMDY